MNPLSSHRNSVTYLRSHTPLTVSSHKDLSPAIAFNAQREAAALNRLRRSYASGRDGEEGKTKAKSVKLLPKSTSRPISPYLGVNFRQSSSEVTWKSHFAPPPNTARPSKASVKPMKSRGNCISLVSIGQELRTTVSEQPKLQKQTILAWASMQKSLEKKEERVKTPNSKAEIVVFRQIPMPIPANPEIRREIRPEDLSDLLIPTLPEEKQEKTALKRVLHISSQPPPGFLSLEAPTSCKFRLQQPKVKRKSAQSVQRISTWEKQPTFDLPETQHWTALECRQERPKAVRASFIPKDMPLYRIPVDYNIFRYVCKHRERPPRTASSPNLRGTAKSM